MRIFGETVLLVFVLWQLITFGARGSIWLSSLGALFFTIVSGAGAYLAIFWSDKYLYALLIGGISAGIMIYKAPEILDKKGAIWFGTPDTTVDEIIEGDPAEIAVASLTK